MVIELTTNKARVLALDVPEHITEDLFYHPSGQMIDGWSKPNDLGHRIYWDLHDIPKGNWQILSRAGSLSEDQCREIVENVGVWDNLYRNYQEEEPYFDTAKESFASLNIDPNSLVLFEPLK